MLTALVASTLANVVLGYAAYKLKGNRSVKDAVKVVIQGGGGPGEEAE